MQAVMSLFRKAWDFFSIEWPGVGLTFADVYLGAFIAAFALGLLRPILGIGGSLPNAVIRGVSRRSGRERVRKPKDNRDVYHSGDSHKHADGSTTTYYES